MGEWTMETPHNLITRAVYYQSPEGIRDLVSERVREEVSRKIWTKINAVENLWQQTITRSIANSVINNMEFRM